MRKPKSTRQRQFENEVQREYDRLNDLKADKIGISIVLFLLGCLLLSFCQQ